MHTVLIVDDRSDIRRLLHVSLGKAYQIVEAENGASALEAVRLHQPGLVLLDVMMPGEVNGMQVLEAIKSNPLTRSTWVALLSARNQPADQEEARARGADAYFIKPFSPPQVVAWVRSKLK
jgi:CheY-like chemotaxis protein